MLSASGVSTPSGLLLKLFSRDRSRAARVVDDLLDTGMYLPISSGGSLFTWAYEQGVLREEMSREPRVNDEETGVEGAVVSRVGSLSKGSYDYE